MVHQKDFDIYLRVMKSADEYHADKVKAGTMGGSAGRGKKKPSSIMNAKMMWWNSIRKPTKLSVVCLHPLVSYAPLFRFETGRHYIITMDKNATMVSPTIYAFEDWTEFLRHFSKLKTLKENKPRRKPEGGVHWNESKGYWRARITYKGKTYEYNHKNKQFCDEWLAEKRRELGV